jgi:hypothetical protein
MIIYIRLHDDKDWNVTFRVDLDFQGYGKGYWKVFYNHDPWALLCLRPGGWFDYDPNTRVIQFQCQDQYGSWVNSFYICDGPSTLNDTSCTSGDGMLQQMANPAGQSLLIDWYRLDQGF